MINNELITPPPRSVNAELRIRGSEPAVWM